MSLESRLAVTANVSRPGLPCRLGSLLQGTELADSDKAYLKKILDVPLGEPTRIPAAAIAAALREEGFEIRNAAIQRHRRRECRCYGTSPKFASIED